MPRVVTGNNTLYILHAPDLLPVNTDNHIATPHPCNIGGSTVLFIQFAVSLLPEWLLCTQRCTQLIYLRQGVYRDCQDYREIEPLRKWRRAPDELHLRPYWVGLALMQNNKMPSGRALSVRIICEG